MISRSRWVLMVLLLVALCACSAPPVTTPVAINAGSSASPEPSLRPSDTATATAVPSATPTDTPAPATRTPLSVFCAGSLMIPFAAIEPAFEAAHPDIDMLMEAHGSIQVIRHVTDIHEEIDVVASADHALLSQLMYNTLNPDSGQPYARWNIRFATNRMALAYGQYSRGADEINAENWIDILSRPGTRLGLADPRFDACGYRTLMILQLAEKVYDRKTLFEDLLMGRFGQPIRAVLEGDRTVIHVPEVLEPRTNSTIVMRGSSVQLIPLLQSGDLDYIFEYESVALQHGLSTIALPPELDLGTPEQAAFYDTVETKLDFRRFASVVPVFRGEVIAYGITIPTNAPHPEAAETFVAFLLGPEGQAIMAENHHPLLKPLRADHLAELPVGLQGLCEAE